MGKFQAIDNPGPTLAADGWTGSPAQIKWAKSLKESFLKDIEIDLQEMAIAGDPVLDDIRSAIDDQTSAVWWIERRLYPAIETLNEFWLMLQSSEDSA